MPVPSVSLTGPALMGVDPSILIPPILPTARPRPLTVRLGRRTGAAPAPGPRLADFVDSAKLLRALPTSTNHRAKAGRSIARMYANDRYGCCVISGKMHHAGVWSVNNGDSSAEVFATDAEVIRQYQTICGPGDNGCMIGAVLDYQRQHGLTMGGLVHKIDGYVYVDWSKPELVKATIAFLGGLTIGFNLPGSWTSSAVWDVTNSGIVGGHDVAMIDYDDTGVYLASWGRLYRMTWAAIADRRYIEEAYAILSPDWYGVDGVAESGLKVSELRTALAEIGAGHVPVDPVTPPPPPPPPPVVSGWEYHTTVRTGEGDRVVYSLDGWIGPRQAAAVADVTMIECGDEGTAALLNDLLFTANGIDCSVCGTTIHITRTTITPEQFAALVALLVQLIDLITKTQNLGL